MSGTPLWGFRDDRTPFWEIVADACGWWMLRFSLHRKEKAEIRRQQEVAMLFALLDRRR